MLGEHGVESPGLDARILVCAACGIDHAALLRDPDRPLGPGAPILINYVSRRLAGEPVARILGKREFWGLSVAIDEAVLDPRPDTEGVVGSILDALGGQKDGALKVLDLGTGSAAILCALLTELPRAQGIGVDRSFAACRTAERNLKTLGIGARARIVCGSWTDAVRARFDIVVANPPYIPRGDIAGLPVEVRDYDPPDALDGGADGLDAYRTIVPALDDILLPNGIVAFECGWDQGAAVNGLMTGSGLHGVRTYKDLGGQDRVVLGVKGGGNPAKRV